jgi:heme oxygenase (biliverdin-producing, ferredoxin)
MSLSSELKESTSAYHVKAEKHPWVRMLMKKELTLTAYYQYLSRLLPVYQALENALIDAPVDLAFDNRLMRTTKIKQDLDYLRHLGMNTISLEDGAYGAYMKTLPNKPWPSLVGHVYARYFGDMQGGRFIKNILKAHYHIEDEGLNFYDFNTFYDAYPEGIGMLRSTIDALNLSNTERSDVIKSAKKAFVLTYQTMTESLN